MQRHELYFIAFMFTVHEYYRADISFCKPVFGKVDLQNDLFMYLHVYRPPLLFSRFVRSLKDRRLPV